MRAQGIHTAIPSAVCPSVGCSSSSTGPIPQRPGTASGWIDPSDSGRRRWRYSCSSNARSSRWAAPGSRRSGAAVLWAQPSVASGKASGPSRWSQSACVTSSPRGVGNAACSMSEGSSSSSSGRTGESIMNASTAPVSTPPAVSPSLILGGPIASAGPARPIVSAASASSIASTGLASGPRAIVQFSWSSWLVMTSTSRWSEIAFTLVRKGLGDAEQLGGLAQVAHFGGRFLLRGVEGLLVAVDPDDGHALFDARNHVVVVAGGHVHPAALAADAPGALGEVRGFGLVGAHLLGVDDEVEVDRAVAGGLAPQFFGHFWG